MGPSSAYLFFGRQTINDGPEREEFHQFVNLLMGPMVWVGQPASILSIEYPLVKGRQAVAMAWEQECKEKVHGMHSEKSCRHIPEVEWDWDWNSLVPWSSGWRSPSQYLSGGTAKWKPALCLGSEHKDPCPLLATFNRGHGSWRCSAQMGGWTCGVGRPKQKSRPVLDPTPPSSSSPPRPQTNGGYLMDLSVNSRDIRVNGNFPFVAALML